MNDIIERYWFFVDRTGGEDACWKWYGTTDSLGYGRFSYPGRGRLLAHRFAVELARGRDPVGYVVRHLCGSRLCVNPRHLTLLSPHEATILGRRRAG